MRRRKSNIVKERKSEYIKIYSARVENIMAYGTYVQEKFNLAAEQNSSWTNFN